MTREDPRLGLVLVTGSRAWSDRPEIERRLAEARTAAVAAGCAWLLVLHGGASGADRLADTWARRHAHEGVAVRGVPADWAGLCAPECRPGHRRTRVDGSSFCPTAGPRRNQVMVDQAAAHAAAGGWVRVLAFHLQPGGGTADCARRAERAGLDVHRFGMWQ